MASPGVVTNDLRVVRGQSKKWLLEVKEKDTGDAYSLESGEVRMTVKRDVKVSEVEIYKTSEDVSEIKILTPQTDDENKGKAYIYLEPRDTLAIDPGEYLYDVWVKNAAGDWYPVVKQAKFYVDWSITVFE